MIPDDDGIPIYIPYIRHLAGQEEGLPGCGGDREGGSVFPAGKDGGFIQSDCRPVDVEQKLQGVFVGQTFRQVRSQKESAIN